MDNLINDMADRSGMYWVDKSNIADVYDGYLEMIELRSQNKKGTPAPPWRRGSSAGHILAGMARMTVFLLYSSVRTNTTPRRPSASGTVTASSVTAGAAFSIFPILISSH